MDSGTPEANRCHSSGKIRPTSWVSHCTSRREVVVTVQPQPRRASAGSSSTASTIPTTAMPRSVSWGS